MLGGSTALSFQSGDYSVSYINRFSLADPSAQDAAANISIDTSLFPGLAQYVTDIKDPSNNNARFLKGYSDITITGIGTVTGVTLNPGQGPHLVSSRAFTSQKGSPTSVGVVPPNSFISSAIADGTRRTVNFAAATAGAIKSFSTLIPGGFVRISNVAGLPYDGANGLTTDTALNYELFDGIFLVNLAATDTEPAQVGFCGNASLLKKWIDYNQSLNNYGLAAWTQTDWPVVEGKAITGQTTDDPPATVFDSQGNPAGRRTLGRIISFRALGSDNQPRKYTYLDLAPQGGDDDIKALYFSGAIEKAHEFEFGRDTSGNMRKATFSAIEAAKALLINDYYKAVVIDNDPSSPYYRG